MNLIVSEVYDALIEAGASEEKARAAAGAIPLAEHLATTADIAALRTDNAEHRAATAADIAEHRAATTADTARLERELAVLKMGVFTIGPVTLALLVKLVFFP